MRRKTGGTALTGGMTAGLCVWAGCAEPPRAEPVVWQAPPPPEPSLPVASDAQVTLFGELPEHGRVPFQARAAAPMKQHTTGREGADFDPRISPDGKWLAFCSTRHSPQPDLYLKSIDGQAITQLTSDPAADVQPCLSPDGKHIAFTSNRAGNWDLWLLSLENGRSSQITTSPLQEVHPSFAPDGRRVAYCAFNSRSGQWELWTLHLDQPGSRRMLGLGLYPQWSPAGESLLFQRARQRGGRWFSIWRMDLENGEPRFPQELAASSEMALIQPAWSLDGNWIAYGTARAATAGGPGVQGGPVDAGVQSGPIAPGETRGDIWMMRADGSEPARLTDGSGVHFGPAWGADGRVYFSSRQDGSENIWSVRAAMPGPGALAAQPLPADRAASANHVPARAVVAP